MEMVAKGSDPMRQPRWMRGLKTKSMFGMSGPKKQPLNHGLTGILLCLLGAGIILAALPGWVYLLLIGFGVLSVGLLMLRG